YCLVFMPNLIWNTLKKLRVDPGDRHEEFGDVKKVVTDELCAKVKRSDVNTPCTFKKH
uniref:Uncharacterized protein n=1 Tax=Labrus bergylta TaxID=56723 RepID=A0A3Q3E9D5_9LABR